MKVIGQRSSSLGQKRDFRSHLIVLQVILEVKGHMSEGQRSHGSRSEVNLKVVISADGLISMISCIIFKIGEMGKINEKRNSIYLLNQRIFPF